MKTTIEQLMHTRMKAFTIYNIGNVEVSFHPETPMYGKFYKVFAPGLGVEQFGNKQKAIDYMLNDLQL